MAEQPVKGAPVDEPSASVATVQSDMSDLSSQPMTESHKDKLTDHAVLIAEKLQDVELVLDYLKEKNCLHEKTRQRIMAETTHWDKHQQLLWVLKRGSEASFHWFLESLLETQDDANIYNLLCDDPKPPISKNRTGPPLLGPAREYYLRLRDFHRKKLQKLAQVKPSKHELTSYVQMNIYSKQQRLLGMRTGFRESAMEAVQVLGNPIELDNLFSAQNEGAPPSKVLLLGAPGVGKSMTAYHFLSQNTDDKLWKEDIHFIIFIILNELNSMNSNISFEDILFNVYGPPVENAKKTIKYLQKDQEKVLFILDGYDELEGLGVNARDEHRITFQRLDKETKPQQLIYNLISGNILPKSKVLVTGRPHVLEKLRNLTNREVEVLGLDRDKLNELTHKELANHPGLVKDVIQYFDMLPNVVNLCSVPVNAKGVLEYVKFNPEAANLSKLLPQTKAGFLFMIVLNLLCHHDKSISSAQGLLSSEILEKRKRLIYALSKVAYEGLFGSEGVKQYFNPEIIAKYGASEDEVIQSGLMTGYLSAISDIYKHVEKILLKFDHLTKQEFFSALELSQLPLKDLEAISQRQNGERDVVLQLSLGAMGDQQCQGLLANLYPDTPIEDYNQKAARLLQAVWSSPRHYQPNGILYSIHCLSESTLLHMAKELIQRSANAFNALNLSDTIITPADCHLIADCLNNASDPCFDVVLNGKLDSTGLQHIIQSRGTKGLSLITDLTPHIIGVVSKAISHNVQLTKLTLLHYQSSSPLTNVDWTEFQPDHNTALQCLRLQNDHRVHTVCDKLHSLHALQALILYDCILSDIRPLSNISNTIKYLTLDTCGLHAGHITLIAHIVLQNGLVWLDISNNDIGDNGAATLAQCMQDQGNVLQGLILVSCDITDSGIQNICDSLIGNTNLKVLDLCNNDVGDRVDAAVWALCNSNIEEVYLEGCGISADRGSHLLASLIHNSTLKGLDVSDNSLNTTEFAQHVRDKLTNNQLLQALDLGACGITDESLSIITHSLMHNHHLRLLDLCDNPTLTCASITQLLTNTNLQVLSVAGCGLGREGWRQVGHALCHNQHVEICYVGDGDGQEGDLEGLLEEFIHSATSSQLKHLVLHAVKHKLSPLICHLENTSHVKVSCTQSSDVVWMLSGQMWGTMPHDIRNWHVGYYSITY